MDGIVHRFYDSFKKLDAESMVACYHQNVVFSDPAFGTLKGEAVKNMWRMLIASQKGKDFQVYFDQIQQNEDSASAHWEAKYTFSKTGRKVHNVIEARFKLQNGLIIEHHDEFNLHRWARQALGFTGLLLGGTHFFKNKLQKQTCDLLTQYENTHHT
jgi:ketosteroid isomerase-like protein